MHVSYIKHRAIEKVVGTTAVQQKICELRLCRKQLSRETVEQTPTATSLTVKREEKNQSQSLTLHIQFFPRDDERKD